LPWGKQGGWAPAGGIFKGHPGSGGGGKCPPFPLFCHTPRTGGGWPPGAGHRRRDCRGCRWGGGPPGFSLGLNLESRRGAGPIRGAAIKNRFRGQGPYGPGPPLFSEAVVPGFGKGRGLGCYGKKAAAWSCHWGCRFNPRQVAGAMVDWGWKNLGGRRDLHPGLVGSAGYCGPHRGGESAGG